MSVEKRVRAYLELAAKDAEAAELLLAGGNRYSAYHVQQAIEKITKALLLARGIEAGIEHRLEELFKRFPSEDEWPARLLPFVGYSAYATSFRYPTPAVVFPPIHQQTPFDMIPPRFVPSLLWLGNNFSMRPLIAERAQSYGPEARQLNKAVASANAWMVS